MKLAAVSCTQIDKNTSTPADDVPEKDIAVTQPVTADTLQLMHFDANANYYFVYFLNSKRDTVRLITDKQLKEKFLNLLVQVQWKPDSMFEAGEREQKYGDKRLLSLRKIEGKPFVAPVAERIRVPLKLSIPNCILNCLYSEAHGNEWV